tara:strand:+ start:219 stop:473 length:255 start_codon:yes stop_codon:yes gene_type:complete
MTMSDHQDSENFAYNRSWEDIETMLSEAERKQNQHLMAINRKGADKRERMYHMRKYKGLEGVIRGLRWVLGDLKMSRKRVLGDE